jgi:2,4-didehydro-3-deoxy-L-rhamnonate hydrolase
MRLINLDGRAHIEFPDGVVDVAAASDGRFPASTRELCADWPAFTEWARSVDPSGATPFDRGALGPVIPDPRQIFAIGLNYRAHAAEVTLADDASFPPVFTKFVSSLAGPYGEVRLSGDEVDWEVELVVAIAHGGRAISEEDAWAHVAGLAIGQDFSDRGEQFGAPSPQQFSLSKSHAGYSPVGPALVSVDEFSDVGGLRIQCAIDGEIVQSATLREMTFGIPALIAGLSRVCELLPGDIIFAGTPNGVGMGRTPKRWLVPGEEIVSTIEGIGEMRHVAIV